MDLGPISQKLDHISAQLDALKKGQTALNRTISKRPPRTTSVAAPVADGPIPPASFRLNPNLYGPFTRLEWLLLERLWGKAAVLVGDVLGALYGHDHEQDQDALRSVVKRLNPKFRKQSFPGRVVLRNGYVALQLVRNGSGATTR
jgi:hypothetical protein